jgi:hypothetical protein
MMSTSQKHNKILIILFLVFLLVYNFTNITIWWPMLASTGHLIFNWPDATANYFFADLFAKTNQFQYFEPLNLLTDNLLHARSFNVVDGSLVPITFLPALVIFGGIFRILGEFGILAFTPLLAALSGLLIYRLVYYIFKDLDLALISAILFWSLAPVIFFANVVMLPNILFIFLALAGWWAITKSLIFKKNFYWILGSLFLALAVFVRPTEVIWLALLWIFLIYFNKKKLKPKRCLSGILIFLAVAFAFLSFNKLTYGGFLSTGYLNLQSGDLSPEFEQQQSTGLLDYIKLLIAPFGFNLKLIFSNFYNYFIKIIAPHFILAILGLSILFYKKQINTAWKKYLMLTPFIFGLILIYYASWDLADPLVKELNKISISYVRYFLPLYIWILPLVAWGIKQIFFGPTKINKLAYYIILIALVLSSFKLAFYSKNDGLLKNQETLRNYYIQYQSLSEIVEDNAIIITDRSDKVFFPKYRVITPQGDFELWPRVKNIVNQVPIYYYTAKSNEELLVDLGQANQVKLDLTDSKEIWSNFRLFSIKKHLR